MRTSIEQLVFVGGVVTAAASACTSPADFSGDLDADALRHPKDDDAGAPDASTSTGGGGGGSSIDPAVGAAGVCPHDKGSGSGTLVDGLTIPSAHPRIWWTAERIARAKAWLATHPVSAASDDYVNQAFLHVVNGADCSPAVAWARGYTISSGELAGVASDNARWNGERAILVYDWCNDQLTPQDKTTLVTRWNDYLTKSMNKSWGGPQMPGNNYYWGYTRNELEWGMATFGENASAKTFLDDALVTRWQGSFLPYAAGTGDLDGRGGIPLEGVQYGAYLAGYPTIPFDTASLFGRSLYDETDFFKGSVLYTLHATLPGPTTSGVDGKTGFEMFPFNDDEVWPNHSSAARFADFMAQAAIEWDCLPIGKYARSWLKMTGASAQPVIASVDDGGDTQEIAQLPFDYYAPGPKYFYGRNAWGPSSTAFNWQLGSLTKAGVGHYHYDYGNFQIWRGGRWLSRETVGYSNTYTGFGGSGTVGSNTAFAHNTLLVNGMGFASPSDANMYGAPIVRRLESQPAYSYAAVDLTGAYRNLDPSRPERDNPSAGHVERELVFVRPLETTVILDRLQSNAVGATPAANVAKTFLAHFEQPPAIASPTHVTYTSGDQALDLRVLVPAAPQTRVVDERTANGANGTFRLEVSTSGAAQSYILTVLQAKGASAPALSPVVKEDASAFTVTLDATTSIVFAKGAASAGGSITVGGATKNLRADVQGIAITDAGPAWK